MTREKAIEVLENRLSQCQYVYDTSQFPDISYPGAKREIDALEIALSALRPVSREQVEKVFGGKWEEETYTTVSGRGRVIHSKKCTCSACGKANGRAKTNFCPHCGAPLTDEAVEMVMERLEEMRL